MQSDFVFTSESVTRGHPDKLCDQISDAVVDHFLRQDPFARVVTECAVSTGIVFISVKHVADATVDVTNTARRVIEDVGYAEGAFNARTCSVVTSLIEERASAERKLDERRLEDEELGRIAAGEQATVSGYACTHTPTLMPLPVWLANRVARHLDAARMDGHLPQLAPDGKVQVGIEFRGGAPRRVHAITLVTAERNGTTTRPDELDEAIRLLVLGPAFDGLAVRPDDQTRIAINPEGPVLGGGPHLHAGLTGHKGAADGYGGFARESVSGLSGKDPARIDRVGAYAARYAAKNVVAAGLATHCEVLLSYTLGQASPVSVQVETFGTAKRTDDEIAARVLGTFDFRPAAIVRAFGLRDLPLQRREGFFTALAAYGQVGRDDLELPWERVDRVEALGS